MTTVLFVFPPEMATTAMNMNYCIVAFGVILLIAMVQWILDGRKNYTGPEVDIDALMNGHVEASTGGKGIEAEHLEYPASGTGRREGSS